MHRARVSHHRRRYLLKRYYTNLSRSTHESTPSLFSPFISGLPLQIPGSFYTAIEVIKAFTHCVTPQNPSYPRHSSLASVFTINLQGNLVGAEIKLSTSGIDTRQGLLDVPAHAGFRAFDVFYYLNSSSASRAERDWLNLKDLSQYTLLNRSGTYSSPSYLPASWWTCWTGWSWWPRRTSRLRPASRLRCRPRRSGRPWWPRRSPSHAPDALVPRRTSDRSGCTPRLWCAPWLWWTWRSSWLWWTSPGWRWFGFRGSTRSGQARHASGCA